MRMGLVAEGREGPEMSLLSAHIIEKQDQSQEVISPTDSESTLSGPLCPQSGPFSSNAIRTLSYTHTWKLEEICHMRRLGFITIKIYPALVIIFVLFTTKGKGQFLNWFLLKIFKL